MATMVNQEEYDRDRFKLRDVPAPWRGISAEPLLSRIILDHASHQREHWLDWMITGGESGPGFRQLDMDAVRYMRDQCRDLGITFHHKQNGGVRGKDAGCLVDGVEHKHFPPALAT
jgi:protein gp37